METLKTVLFLLLSAGCFGQGFPVSPTARELDEIAKREGVPMGVTLTITNVTLTGVGQDLTTWYPDQTGPYPVGAAYWPYVKKITFLANRDIFLGVRVDNSGSNIFKGTNDNLTPNSYPRYNSNIELKKDQYRPIESSLLRLGWLSNITFVNMGYTVSDTTKLKLSISIEYYNITKNTDVTSPNVLLWIGDSISNGTGATAFEYDAGKEPFTQQVKKHLIQNGARFWMRNASQSSMTSSSLVKSINWGYFEDDPERVKLICLMIGANDANNLGSGGLSVVANQTIFTNNINYILNYLTKRFSRAKILMIGSTPSADNTTEARIEISRTLMQAAVTALNNPNVKYFNAGTLFDRTNSANYLPSDQIHLTNQNAVAGGLNGFLDSLIPIGWTF